MVSKPIAHRRPLPLPTKPGRFQSLTGVDRPLATLQRMSSNWPASRSRIRSLVYTPPIASSADIVQWPIPLGVCDQVSDGLLISPVSGLMGLGWQSLAASGAKPFWQALYDDNVLDEPVMAFYLTRYQNDSRAQDQEPGGVFTLGSS
jgi:Eukaryotic aspartyl protease